MVEDEVGTAHGAGVVSDHGPLGRPDVVHVKVAPGVCLGVPQASLQISAEHKDLSVFWI